MVFVTTQLVVKKETQQQHLFRDPEGPSGLVARSPRRRSGFDSRSVGLSEINFSDLYCGWLSRNINVEYNTIQYITTQLGRGSVNRRVRTLGKSFTRNCSCASA